MSLDHQYWIEKLNLKAHPEGGFYKETFRSSEIISGLNNENFHPRNISTSIYFLLRSSDISAFHRIKSDELWYFHAGSSLTIYCLKDTGHTEIIIGSNPERGESFQAVIPANTWFGAKVNQPDSYTLVSCSVAPGFDFNDFELAERKKLLTSYPSNKTIIEALTSP